MSNDPTQKYLISVPISIQISKKKKFYLNLNGYRNAHFRVLHKAKKDFHDLVKSDLLKLPIMKAVELTFILFPGSRANRDTANVCSVVEKFFCDSLVECGRLEDDNYTVVLQTLYQFGEVDPNNPRVEVTIRDMTKTLKEDPMQILFNQKEIEAGIRLYVESKVNLEEGQKIDIDLRATRGDEGFTAEISITDPEDLVQEAASAKTTTAPASTSAPTPAPTATRKPKPVMKAEALTEKPDEVPAEEPEPAKEESASTEETFPNKADEAESETVESEADTTGGEETANAEEPASKPKAAEPKEEQPKRQSLFGGLGKPSNS